jgi:hypothetical protein
MMRPTTWIEQAVLLVALNEYLDRRAPGAIYDDDSIMESATAYVKNRYGHNNPDLAIRSKRIFGNIKLAIRLIASDIHINDM